MLSILPKNIMELLPTIEDDDETLIQPEESENEDEVLLSWINVILN